MNIVVFGSCESTWNSSFINILKESDFKVYSFSYASVTPLSHVYNLLRERNQNIIKEADLIILNIGNIGFKNNNEAFKKYSLFSYYYIYKILSNLQKKVLVIIWYEGVLSTNRYTNFHKMQCEKYGFNLINTYDFCLKENLLNFYKQIQDFLHPMSYNYGKMAQKIIQNIKYFKEPKKQIKSFKIPSFVVLDLDDFMDVQNNTFCNARTYLYRENVLKIENDIREINFPKQCFGMKIVGVHTWNECFTSKNFFSNIVFENHEIKCSIMSFSWESFRFFDFDFIIDENVKIHNIIDENVKRPKYDEYNKNFENNKQAGVIGFLLLPLNENMEKIDFIEKDVVLSKEYDFTYLCNYLKDFKIIIEQYNQRMDPIKLVPLQNQIKEKDNIISTLNQEKTMLQNELNSFPIKKQNLEIKNLEQDLKNKELQSFVLKKELGNKFVKNININYIDKNSAKSRIQNHLSYKLGQALITNSKSILGYIRMPFVLSYIKDKHKFEQKAYEEKIKDNPNLALPPLETYPDYNEALKEKECFTYKLGEALMQANKNWYGGGVYQIYIQRCA
ncbi:hypothetical protein A0M39_09855 [Campylobacter jejuni]|uniref:hypothetical protein n=1 Tax=Campylobacter jejuni TaxID=197 RepID=UPI0009426246|nr:hypothetical protein [Campylobacter jejuni]OKY02009.1 hypothetical protein A0M39_09855 [Campylobacter jejuni]